MITEPLTYLTGLARQATAPTRVETSDLSTAIYLNGDGTMTRIDLATPCRRHAVWQLDDLIALAARFAPAAADEAEDSGLRPVVWYDESAVVLVIDDESYRSETATLSLSKSDAFRVVNGLAGGTSSKPFDWKSFIRLLRIDLAGTLPPAALLEIVRKVKFDNGTVVKAEMGRNRESLGREITAAVSAESEIPDTVTLSVPVYSTAGEADRYPVRCTVEVDAMAGTFRLVPFPDEIEKVQQMAVGSIAARLRVGLPEAVPSYYGRP